MKLLGRILLLLLLVAGAAPARAGDCPRREPPLGPALHQVLYQAQEQMQAKKEARALGLLQDYARRHPGPLHFRYWLLRGILEYHLGRLTQAEKSFRRSLRGHPCYLPTLRNLAVTLLELGRPLEGAPLLQRAYALSQPPDPQVLYQAAMLYLQGRRPGRALAILEELCRRPHARKSWLKALVQCCLDLKRFDQARGVLKRLLRREPGDPLLWRILAELNIRVKDYPAAAAALEVAYRLEPPSSPTGWRRLAELYRAAGAPLSAARYYRRAWGEHPRPRDLERLAKLYYFANYPKRALALARDLVKQEPTPERWALLGSIYQVLRRHQEAYQAFSQAARLGDKAGRYSLMAGYCAWRLDRLPEALAAFRLARRHAGKHRQTRREAERALESLEAQLRYLRRLRSQEHPTG